MARVSVGHAPGRINLIGEHTDYNDGLVLPIALDLIVTVQVRERSDGLVHLVTDAELDPRETTFSHDVSSRESNWADRVRGLIAELRRRGADVAGFDAAVSATLPPGAGLGSSAAFTIAFLRALDDLFRLGLEEGTAVEIAHAVENGPFVGARAGLLDQLASVYGTRRAALLIDLRDRSRASTPRPGTITRQAATTLGAQSARPRAGISASRRCASSKAGRSSTSSTVFRRRWIAACATSSARTRGCGRRSARYAAATRERSASFCKRRIARFATTTKSPPRSSIVSSGSPITTRTCSVHDWSAAGSAEASSRWRARAARALRGSGSSRGMARARSSRWCRDGDRPALGRARADTANGLEQLEPLPGQHRRAAGDRDRRGDR